MGTKTSKQTAGQSARAKPGSVAAPAPARSHAAAAAPAAASATPAPGPAGPHDGVAASSAATLTASGGADKPAQARQRRRRRDVRTVSARPAGALQASPPAPKGATGSSFVTAEDGAAAQFTGSIQATLAVHNMEHAQQPCIACGNSIAALHVGDLITIERTFHSEHIQAARTPWATQEPTQHSAVLRVTSSFPSFSGTTPTISVCDSVARAHGWHSGCTVTVSSTAPQPHVLDTVEVSVKGLDATRAGLWNAAAVLCGSSLHVGQTIKVHDVPMTVRGLKIGGVDVRSGLMSKDTKLAFRSRSAHVVLMLHASREMWDVSPDGTVYAHMALRGFLPRLLQFWNEMGATHRVTVILFSRASIDADPAMLRWLGVPAVQSMDSATSAGQDGTPTAEAGQQLPAALPAAWPQRATGAGTLAALDALPAAEPGTALATARHHVRELAREDMAGVTPTALNAYANVLHGRSAAVLRGSDSLAAQEDFYEVVAEDVCLANWMSLLSSLKSALLSLPDRAGWGVPGATLQARSALAERATRCAIVLSALGVQPSPEDLSVLHHGGAAPCQLLAPSLPSSAQSSRASSPTPAATQHVGACPETARPGAAVALDDLGLQEPQVARLQDELRAAVHVLRYSQQVTPMLAAEGNFLEAINLALDSLAARCTDVALAHQGGTIIVVTAGAGHYEVDYLLAQMTKQRIMDAGFGCDVVSMCRPPLHNVPLFLFVKNPLASAGLVPVSLVDTRVDELAVADEQQAAAAAAVAGAGVLPPVRGSSRASSGVDQHASDVSLTRRLQEAGLSPDMLSAMASRMAYNFPYWLHMAFYGSQWARDRAAMLRGLAVGSEHTRRAVAGLPDVPLNPLLDDTLADPCGSQLVEQALHTARAACAPQLQRQEQVSHAIVRAHATLPVMPYSRMLSLRAPRLLPTGMELPPVLLARLAWQARDRPYMRLGQDRGTVTYVAIGTITARDALRGPLAGLMSVDVESASGVALIGMPTQLLSSGAQRSKALMTAARTLQRAYAHLQAGLLQQGGPAGMASASSFQLAMSTLHFSTDDAQQASLSMPASAAAAACAAGASQCAPRLGVVFRPASCPADSLSAVPPISTAYFVLEGHLPGFKALHGAPRMLPAALRSTAGAWEALCHADVRAVLQSAKLVDAHMTRPVLLWFAGLRKLITDSMYKSVSRAAWLSAWRNADLGLWQRLGPMVAPLGQSAATLHSMPADAEHGRMRPAHSGGSKLALRHNSAGPSLRDAGGSLPPKYTKSPYLTPRQGARIEQANQIMLPISVGMPAVAAGEREGGTRDRSHSSFSQPAKVPVLAAVPVQPAALGMARAQPSRTQSQMNLASVTLETSSTARRLPVAGKPAHSLVISAKHGALPLCHSAERSPTFFIEGESPHVGDSLVTPQTQPAPAPEASTVPELALNPAAQQQPQPHQPPRQHQVQIRQLGKASSLHTGAVLDAPPPRQGVRGGAGAAGVDSEPRPAKPSELRSATSVHASSMGRAAQGAAQPGRSSRSSPAQSFRLTSRAAHRAQARAAAHASSSALLPAGKDMESWARRTLDKFCANPFVRRTVTGMDTTANRRRWSHISPEQPEDELLAAVHRQGVWPGEQLHVQHNYDLLLPEEQRLGPYEPNWRALAEPAILPLTTDYLPDEATFSREFNESEYGMILPLAGQQASARPRKPKGKVGAAGSHSALAQATPNGIAKFEEPALPTSWGPGSLPTAQHGDVPLEHIGVIKALVCLRLAHGFQFVCPRDVQHKFGSGLSSGHSSLRQSSSQVRSIGKRSTARATVHSLWQGSLPKGPARTLPAWSVRAQMHPSASATDLLAMKEARPAASALRSGARVLYYLSIGHHIHQLSYNREQGQLAVRIYYRKWGWRTSGAFAALVAVTANTTMARELNASAAAAMPGAAGATAAAAAAAASTSASASSTRLQAASDARSARMLMPDMQRPSVAVAAAASKLTEDPQVQGYMMRKLEAASRMPDVFMHRYRLWHAAGQCSVVQHAAFAAGGAGVEFSAEARAPDATPRARPGKADSTGVVLMPVMARSGQAAAAGKFLERGNNWNEIDSYVTDGAVLDGSAACFQQVGLLVVPRELTRAQCRTAQGGAPEYTWESFQGIIQHLEQHLAPRTSMPVVEPELSAQDTQASPSQSPIAAKRRTVSTVRLHFPASGSNVVPESVLAPIAPGDYAVQNSAVAHAQEVLVVMPTTWQADSVWRLTVKWLAAPPARLREWLKALARCARTAGAALVPQSPGLRRSSLPSTVRLCPAPQPCATLQLCTCVPGPVCSSMEQLRLLVDRRDWHVPGWSGGSSATPGSSVPGQVDALPSTEGNALEVGITLAASPGACVLHNKVGSWGKQDEVVLSMVQALQARWGYVMDVWRAGDVHDGDTWYVQLLYAARDIVLQPHDLAGPAALALADAESASGSTLDTASLSAVSKTAPPPASSAATVGSTPAGSSTQALPSPPAATSQRSARATRASANIVHPPPWPQFDAAGAWAIRIDAAGVHWLPNSHTQAALALLMYGQPEATSEAPLCVHTLRQHLLAVTAALHAAHPSQFQQLPASPASLA